MTSHQNHPEGRNPTQGTSAARRRAVEAGHAGDVATARALLGHDDPGVRAAALRALHRAGAATKGDVAVALADASASVRHAAVAVAIPHREVDLTPLLRDDDPAVAEQAAWALGEREDAQAVDPLLIAARHRDPLVREAAVAALGAIQDVRGLAAILAGTADRPAVRRRAVLALAAFEGREVDAALARAVEDRDWQVRDAAAVILEARGTGGGGAAPEGGP